jgi:hypothetical protein
LNLGVKVKITEIFYRQPVIFGTANERFESYKIVDDDDFISCLKCTGNLKRCVISSKINFKLTHFKE